ncbi:MAG: hypothetical protein ABSH12_02545 [Endomicrobiales bacterium]|jgi:hypothetical protein
MRKIYSIVIFFGLLISLATGLHHLLIAGFRCRLDGEPGLWNRVYAGKLNSRIVVMGSSRAMVNYDSKTLSQVTGKNAIVLGLDARHAVMQYPLLSLYLEKNAKPDLIIQNLDTTLLEKEDFSYPVVYMSYINDDAVYNSLVKVFPFVRFMRYVPLYSFARFGFPYSCIALKGLMGRSHPDAFSQTGTQLHDERWDTTFERFKKLYPHGKRYGIDINELTALRSIAQLAKEKNIPLVMVYSPEYYEDFPYTLNRRQLFRIFKKIADDYNAILWDYSNSPLSNQKTYFYNSQHMSMVGSLAFTHQLGERINK